MVAPRTAPGVFHSTSFPGDGFDSRTRVKKIQVARRLSRPSFLSPYLWRSEFAQVAPRLALVDYPHKVRESCDVKISLFARACAHWRFFRRNSFVCAGR